MRSAVEPASAASASSPSTSSSAAAARRKSAGSPTERAIRTASRRSASAASRPAQRGQRLCPGRRARAPRTWAGARGPARAPRRPARRPRRRRRGRARARPAPRRAAAPTASRARPPACSTAPATSATSRSARPTSPRRAKLSSRSMLALTSGGGKPTDRARPRAPPRPAPAWPSKSKTSRWKPADIAIARARNGPTPWSRPKRPPRRRRAHRLVVPAAPGQGEPEDLQRLDRRVGVAGRAGDPDRLAGAADRGREAPRPVEGGRVERQDARREPESCSPTWPSACSYWSSAAPTAPSEPAAQASQKRAPLARSARPTASASSSASPACVRRAGVSIDQLQARGQVDEHLGAPLGSLGRQARQRRLRAPGRASAQSATLANALPRLAWRSSAELGPAGRARRSRSPGRAGRPPRGGRPRGGPARRPAIR